MWILVKFHHYVTQKNDSETKNLTGLGDLSGFTNRVGAIGFEPTTSCTPCKRATGLRHAPICLGCPTPIERPAL